MKNLRFLQLFIAKLEKDKINYIGEDVIIEQLLDLGFKESKIKKDGRNHNSWSHENGDYFTRIELETTLKSIGFRFDRVVRVWIRKGGEAGLEATYIQRLGELGEKRYADLLMGMKIKSYFAFNKEYEEYEELAEYEEIEESKLLEKIENIPGFKEAIQSILSSEEAKAFDYLNLPRHRIDAYFPDMLLGEVEMLAKKRGSTVPIILENIVLEYFELKKIKFNQDNWMQYMYAERDKLKKDEEYIF